MPDKRGTRFLPNRSKFAFTIGLLLIALAGIAFLDLAATKGEALSEQQQARYKIALIQEQNERLERALEQAREEQNVIPRAFRYFGRMPTDMTLVVPADEPPAEPAQQPQVRPADSRDSLAAQLDRTVASLKKWVEWDSLAEQADRSLTNLLKWVQ
jgi:hypothetical protein